MAKAAKASDVDLLLADHRVLRETLRELREYLERPRPELEDAGSRDWARSLAKHLFALHERLLEHFRAEESTGVFEDMADRFPRAANKLRGLLREHSQILADLRAVTAATMSYAEGAPPPDPRLRRWTRSLLGKLQAHEQYETDLLQRLVYEDIGIAD